MLLLNTRTLRLEEIQDPLSVRYAILSHTWGDDEVSFKDLKDFARAKKQAGFAKIAKTCELALKENLEYAWVDACCINKSSSSELSEAINSMFSWYRHSAVCFVWLDDLTPVYQAAEPIKSTKKPPQEHAKEFHDISDMGSCVWFSRGWTLQELLAPREIKFYDADWGFRFTKKDRISDLSRITHIDEDVLTGEKHLKNVLVGVKMSWAADRKTTRPEDIAYCLMGIFDINMPMLYGEGQKAFERLQEHIVGQSKDSSLFAWRSCDPPDQFYRGIFARSPREFKSCAKIRLGTRLISDPDFSLTNRGVQFRTESLIVDDDTHFVMRLSIKCEECIDHHDVHICLLRTTKGHVRVAPHTCWKPPGARELRDPTKIYCRKDVDLLENSALQRVASNPLRVSLDFNRKYLHKFAQYPKSAWDPTCGGFCGDALAEDFSGFIDVYTKVPEVLVLTVVIHKLVHEARPDVELYAAPRYRGSLWKVVEGYTSDDLYGGRRLDAEKLLTDYKTAKAEGSYQRKRKVHLKRRETHKSQPIIAAFEAKLDGLHVTISLIVSSDNGRGGDEGEEDEKEIETETQDEGHVSADRHNALPTKAKL